MTSALNQAAQNSTGQNSMTGHYLTGPSRTLHIFDTRQIGSGHYLPKQHYFPRRNEARPCKTEQQYMSRQDFTLHRNESLQGKAKRNIKTEQPHETIPDYTLLIKSVQNRTSRRYVARHNITLRGITAKHNASSPFNTFFLFFH